MVRLSGVQLSLATVGALKVGGAAKKIQKLFKTPSWVKNSASAGQMKEIQNEPWALSTSTLGNTL